MSSPKIICKSGYITDTTHVFNTLEYAGNKIDQQHIVFKDGSTAPADPDTKLSFSPAQQEQISCIHLVLKDGSTRDVSCEAYLKMTGETQAAITVSDLSVIADESMLLVNSEGKSYHKTEDLNFFSYLSYIEDRPGVEKTDGHGLFGLQGDIPIQEAKATALEYESSRKWSHIISLEASGAIRTGYDNRELWAALIRTKAPQIAQAYNISLENLVINCAYHGNTDNPHVHLLFYSKDHREGFVKGGKKGMQGASEKLKSILLNEIYRGDVAELKTEHTQLRQELRRQLDARLQSIHAKDYSHAPIAEMLLQLSHDLHGLPGKKQYGYLPAETKDKVNDILKWIFTQDSDMRQLLEMYCQSYKGFVGQYVASPERIEEKVLEFRENFFTPGKNDMKLYHNAIVRAAAELEAQLFSPPSASNEGKNGDFSVQEEPLSSGGQEVFLPDDSAAAAIDEPSFIPPQGASNEGKNEDFTAPDESLSSGKATPISIFRQIVRDKPLNKDLNQLLSQRIAYAVTDDTESALSQIIRQELELYNLDGNPEHAARIVKLLYATDNRFRRTLDNTLAHIYGNLKDQLGTDTAYGLMARFYPTIFTPDCELPLYFSLSQQAKHLSETYYKAILHKHKDAFSSLNKLISSRLKEVLAEPNALNALNQLQELLCNAEKKSEEIQASTTQIFKLIQNEEMGNELTECTDTFHKLFAQYCGNASMRLELCEQIQSDLLHATANSMPAFIIQSFAANLDMNKAKHAFEQLADQVRDYRSALFRELMLSQLRFDSSAKAALVECVQQGYNRPGMDKLLCVLSSRSFDFMQEKESLRQLFIDKMQEKGFYKDEQTMQQLFDTLFYGGSEKYDTIFIKETVQNFYESKERLLLEHSLRQAVKGVFGGISAMIAGQTQSYYEASRKPRGLKHRRKFKLKHQSEHQAQSITY